MDDDDFLAISGIQHFAFCRRQWALIHIERQWAENLRTVEGRLLHERAHGSEKTEKRGDLLIARGLPVFSRSLGVGGVCDVVEFHASPEGVSLRGWDGLWLPYPVEYKKGAPKEHDADELQLCCQALCLEEMLLCRIPQGSLYYGEPRRRTEVDFTSELRDRGREMTAEMRRLYLRGHTPKVRPTKGCGACSLKEICLPRLTRLSDVGRYISEHMKEGGT